MKISYLVILLILLMPKMAGQEIDIKQLPPQEMLEYGALFGNIEIVRLALTKGAEINYDEKLPLCSAIYGANPPVSQEDGNFIEMMASVYGLSIPSRDTYLELIKWLLENGAKATVLSDYNNSENIPLLKAANYRDFEIVKLLLDFKADPNFKSQEGTTALHMLTVPDPFPYPYKKAPEIAKLLISRGAKMISSMDTPTALQTAEEMLRSLEDSASPWRDYPFYDEMVNSVKSLIDIYGKL